MSYRQTYRKTIRIPYSGTVSYSYGPSQSGGSGTAHYSGTAVEEVEVDIEVDTVPFDRSVATCNNHVDALTTSVIATETAQVASIKAKAKQIGDTVVEGFFKTIRFDISNQIVELQKRVEALLLDMHESQKKLTALRQQMERDYHRKAEQYATIFNDLNKELDNRVHALDQPVFVTAANMYAAEDRFMESDMLNIVALSGKENTLLDAQIGTAIAKTHAQKALHEANGFLSKKLATEITLAHCKLNDNSERTFYTPVCYASMTNDHNVQYSKIFMNDMLPEDRKRMLTDKAEAAKLPEMTDEEKENVSVYFQNMLNETTPANEHEQRVKKLIAKLYSL